MWLAKVGYERMQEMADPEKALNRSREYWQKQGRSEKWIQQRMMGQETRNKYIFKYVFFNLIKFVILKIYAPTSA